MSQRRKRTRYQRRMTFAEHCELIRARANSALFCRASTANAMAKKSTGHRKAWAYRIKHRAIKQLIERGRVLITVDRYHYPGLLSVQLDQRHRLHTHEAWLYGTSRKEQG